MSQDETKKIVVRTVFTGIEADGLTDLINFHNISKPQDLMKFLVTDALSRLKLMNTRYGSKRVPRETEDEGPKGPTPEEWAATVLKQDEKYITVILKEIGFLEDLPIRHYFADGDPETQAGKKYLMRQESLRADGKQTDQLYETGEELATAIVEYLKKNPSKQIVL